MPSGIQALEQKESGPIRLYLDFDGTLTGRSGSKCVFSAFYQSLQTNPKESYSACTFKDNMVDQLKIGLAKDENKTMRMGSDALKFLQEMLQLGAEINIVSRNRKEYIRAVLLAEGISLENVNKITIRDVNDLNGGKYSVVLNMEKNKTPTKVTIVCDDDSKDCNGMVKGVKDGGNKTEIIFRSVPPNQFDWENISKEARQKAILSPQVESDGVKEKTLLGKVFSEISQAQAITKPDSSSDMPVEKTLKI